MTSKNTLYEELLKHKGKDIYLSFDMLGYIENNEPKIIPYDCSLKELFDLLKQLEYEGLIELEDTKNMGFWIGVNSV